MNISDRNATRRKSHEPRPKTSAVKCAKLSFTSQSVEETLNLGRRLGEAFSPGTTVALIGPLGAGKTIFVKGLAQGLGVEPVVTSPTFILINEYQGRLPLYHIDAYRLKSTEEFLALGVDEFFYGQGVTAVEWADHIEEALPEEHLNVKLAIRGRYKRNILITPRGSGYRRLLKDLAAKLTS